VTGAVARTGEDARSAEDLALIHVGLGENDQAFEWLDEAYQVALLGKEQNIGLIRHAKYVASFADSQAGSQLEELRAPAAGDYKDFHSVNGPWPRITGKAC
jgi:hypothetical protein